MPDRVPTSGAIARLRERYDAGEPLADLACALGVTQETFRTRRKQWGWPTRRVSRPRKAASKRGPRPGAPDAAVIAADDMDVAAAIAALADTSTPAPSHELLKAALCRALYAELAVLLAGSGSKRGSEPRARALASIGRTLALLGATKETGPESDDDDAPPVDVAELRHELARRLHLISQARDDP